MKNLCYVALVVLGAMDAITTQYSIAMGAHEANPLIAFVMSQVGVGWVVFKVGVTAGLAYWFWAYGARRVTIAACAITGLAVMINSVQILFH
jgi:hypothetical protein